MITLIPDWCQCPKPRFWDAIYFPDDCCPCGNAKLHCHCPDCGAVIQVG